MGSRPACAGMMLLASLLASASRADVNTTGTEFWLCHMENEEAAIFAPFGLAIANPGASVAVVRVEGNTGTLATTNVAPGRVQTLVLPNNRMLFGTTVEPDAFHLVSDRPVRVFQLNPVLNSRSDDISMALPVAALGTNYRVVSRAGSVGLTGDLNPGAVAIVATALEPTTVQLQLTGNIMGDLGGRVPASLAGATIELVLDRFEVVQVETDGAGQDLSGTLITSDRPIAVFGGHVCPNIPDGIGFCDHLEEQLFPTAAWGRDFIAAKSEPRGGESDHWRIVASEDGTVVQTDPDVLGGARALAAGEFVDFATPLDVHVQATAAVQVAQYFVGSQSIGGSSNDGDPSMLLTIPTEQLDVDYLFVTPANYRDDHATIVTPVGASVTVDGTLVPAASFVPVASSGMARARIRLADGPHRVIAPSGAAVYAYGYDVDVSYGYPAGARANAINSNIACDPGGPYEGCLGGRLLLDGSDSTGPGTLEYLWSALSPGVAIVTPDAVATDALLSGSGPYEVSLTIRSGTSSVTCTVTIPSAAGAPPVLDCPPVLTAEPTELRGALVPVLAVVADDCDADPPVVNDRTSAGRDATDVYPCGETVVMFHAVDSGGLVASCPTIVSVQSPTVPAEVSLVTAGAIPLRIEKVDGNPAVLQATFELRSLPTEAYNFYAGTILPTGIVAYDHVPVVCEALPASAAPGTGLLFPPSDPGTSHYFLISASNCLGESSRGSRSDGVLRPALPTDCLNLD